MPSRNAAPVAGLPRCLLHAEAIQRPQPATLGRRVAGVNSRATTAPSRSCSDPPLQLRHSAGTWPAQPSASIGVQQACGIACGCAGHFDVLSKGDVPVMAFRLKPGVERGYDEFDIMHRLKEHQWMVGAVLPAHAIAMQGWCCAARLQPPLAAAAGCASGNDARNCCF